MGRLADDCLTMHDVIYIFSNLIKWKIWHQTQVDQVEAERPADLKLPILSLCILGSNT